MKSLKTPHNIDVSSLSLEELDELSKEIARRRAESLPTDMLSAEQTLLLQHDKERDAAFAAYLENASINESEEPAKCPYCGALCRVRTRHRKRKLRTTTGEHILEPVFMKTHRL